MKKILCTICLGMAFLATSVSAATIELMPEISSITGQGYNSAGRLANNNINLRIVCDHFVIMYQHFFHWISREIS